MILHRINSAVLAVVWLCGIAAGQCVQSQSEVITLYFGVETPPPGMHFQTIPSAHTDIEIPFRFAGGWDVHINTDLPVPNTRIETQNAFFSIGADARTTLSEIPPEYAFIGAAANETFWLFSGYNTAPGFDSQDMTTAEVNALCLWNPNKPDKFANSNNKWLQVRLVAVRGPAGGQVAMFEDGELTPIVFFATFNGIDNDDEYYIVVKSHSHKSWTFTKPGLYEIDLQIATYYQCDASLTEDRTGDCVVDLEDFAALAAEAWMPNDLLTFIDQWLECGSPFDSECP